ncbi:hypothetical protein M8C21_024417, partial [Ambrosia artemisiifolia]
FANLAISYVPNEDMDINAMRYVFLINSDPSALEMTRDAFNNFIIQKPLLRITMGMSRFVGHRSFGRWPDQNTESFESCLLFYSDVRFKIHIHLLTIHSYLGEAY